MWPYWMLFLLCAMLCVSRIRQVAQHAPESNSDGFWFATFLLLAMMIGLRYEVGGDWEQYASALRWVPDSLADALATGDPAYSSLNWVARYFGQGVYFVNSVCAILFAWGLLAFCRTQPNPWLAMVVAVPYLITVVAMGYTRQGVAIGLVMLGLAALDRGHVIRFLFCVALAAAFHKSAVILAPLAALAGEQRRIYVLVLVGMVSFGLFTLLLQESVEDLRVNYIESEYSSTGAAIRVAMNAVPASIFLMLRKHFQLRPAQRTFWTWMAVGGLGFVAALTLSPSSTAVDRVALYWIPLQLFVWSRLPNAMGRPDGADGANELWVYAVVGYSATVHFVWLNYADFANYWLPYQFYPFVS
jgi:hypothetical protein